MLCRWSPRRLLGGVSSVCPFAGSGEHTCGMCQARPHASAWLVVYGVAAVACMMLIWGARRMKGSACGRGQGVSPSELRGRGYVSVSRGSESNPLVDVAASPEGEPDVEEAVAIAPARLSVMCMELAQDLKALVLRLMWHSVRIVLAMYQPLSPPRGLDTNAGVSSQHDFILLVN